MFHFIIQWQLYIYELCTRLLCIFSSADYGPGSLAVDGNKGPYSYHASTTDSSPWLMIDLENVEWIYQTTVFTRVTDRFEYFQVNLENYKLDLENQINVFLSDIFVRDSTTKWRFDWTDTDCRRINKPKSDRKNLQIVSNGKRKICFFCKSESWFNNFITGSFGNRSLCP